jgi:hypothetical protein
MAGQSAGHPDMAPTPETPAGHPLAPRRRRSHIAGQEKELIMNEKTRTELEAAAFRRLVEHLRERKDVQNIDLMNLAGFCRNCLSKWYRAAAEDRGLELSDADARQIVYGMPYDEWKSKYQKGDGIPALKELAAQGKPHAH